MAILDMHMPEMDGLALARTIKADPTIADVQLVLLTSVHVSGEHEDARQAGIEKCLSKPVRQSQLYKCLVTITQGVTERPATRRFSRLQLGLDDIGNRGRVLLVEDNPVNQEVAYEMLSQLGC